MIRTIYRKTVTRSEPKSKHDKHSWKKHEFKKVNTPEAHQPMAMAMAIFVPLPMAGASFWVGDVYGKDGSFTTDRLV